MRLYLDNAASTPMYPEAIQSMSEKMGELYGNPSSIHFFGRHAKNAIEEARKIIADHLGASQGEIFFTSGGTEANNTALKCAVRDLEVRRIISSPIEHHSVLHSCQRLAEEGIKLDLVEIDAKGRPSNSHLEKLLQEENNTLVSIMHANNELGTMIDLEEVSELCEEYGALFHSDTVQTVAHFPLNLSKLKVSFLSGSAHKFHGPKGVGLLYVNQKNIIKPYLDGGGQERNLRAGTENISGIYAMAKAMQIAHQRLQESTAHIKRLKAITMEKLSNAFPEITYNGDPEGNSLYTVLSASFPKSSKSDLLLLNLDIEGISASGGSACSSGAQKESHVLAVTKPQFEGATIRISFSEFNTEKEVQFLIEKLKKILR